MMFAAALLSPIIELAKDTISHTTAVPALAFMAYLSISAVPRCVQPPSLSAL
jgi:hypothetical protein